MAVAHSILVIAYHLIKRHELYRELGGDYFDQRRPEATAKRLARRLERSVQEGEMPPALYLPLHPDANLSDAEKQQLIAGFQATFK